MLHLFYQRGPSTGISFPSHALVPLPSDWQHSSIHVGASDHSSAIHSNAGLGWRVLVPWEAMHGGSCHAPPHGGSPNSQAMPFTHLKALKQGVQCHAACAHLSLPCATPNPQFGGTVSFTVQPSHYGRLSEETMLFWDYTF